MEHLDTKTLSKVASLKKKRIKGPGLRHLHPPGLTEAHQVCRAGPWVAWGGKKGEGAIQNGPKREERKNISDSC